MKSVLLLLLLFPFVAVADETDFTLILKDHHFQPAELVVPAGQKIKIIIDNQDVTPEEFDSDALNREKRIAAQSRVTLYVGPLAAGRYPFDGELHEDTAQGVVIAR